MYNPKGARITRLMEGQEVPRPGGVSALLTPARRAAVAKPCCVCLGVGVERITRRGRGHADAAWHYSPR